MEQQLEEKPGHRVKSFIKGFGKRLLPGRKSKKPGSIGNSESGSGVVPTIDVSGRPSEASLGYRSPARDAIGGNETYGVPKYTPVTTDEISGTGRSALTVVDRGERQYIATRQPSKPEHLPLPTEGATADLIDHTGTGFPTPNLTDPRPADVPDPESLLRHPPDEAERHLKTVYELLWAARLKAYNNDHHYISNEKLDQILTLETIQNILPACLDLDWSVPDWQQEIKAHATRICGAGKPMSFRKTLTVLILSKMHKQLPCFLECELDDLSLPVLCKQNPVSGTEQLCLKKPDSVFEPLDCFDQPDWDHTKRNTFYELQWNVLAPYFGRGTEGNERLQHYPLLKRAPLPFKTIDPSPNQGDNVVPGGHYAEVTFVEIDKAHHQLPSYSSTELNARCALKKLRPRVTRKDFDHEVGILKRLSTTPNNHLVKLLFTMELSYLEAGQGPEFYLVFPLASGDLNGLWTERSPPRRESEEMVDFAQWFLSQCRGITKALGMVHNMPPREESSQSASGSPGGQATKDPYYGIHADIKPANLLWFENWKGATHKLGVIQIADFGISNFHTTDSRSNARLQAFTKTYRAPEIDLFQKVSRSFDIWGLGCVFLEFISWFVLGKHDREEFTTARMFQGLDKVPQDTFYRLHPDNLGTKAVVNPGVIKRVLKLRQHRDCTQFVNEFLDLIMEGMLVVEDKPQRDSWKSASESKNNTPSTPPIPEAGPSRRNPVLVPTSTNSPSRQAIKSSAIGPNATRFTCQEIVRRLDMMRESGRTNKNYYVKQELRRKPSENVLKPQGVIVAQSMESLAEKQNLKW